jgi:hypothetical protein
MTSLAGHGQADRTRQRPPDAEAPGWLSDRLKPVKRHTHFSDPLQGVA